MPAPRLKYEEIKSWSRELIERAVTEDDPEVLLHAVVAASMYDEDWRYAQDLCVRLSRHSHFNVRGNAVLGFGHIARVHGRLEKRIVFPIISAALTDPEEYVRGQAHFAKDDTELFLGWKYETA
jgi:hypothetical protein